MGMAGWCQECGSIALEGDPYVPGCRRCAPMDADKLTGWRLLAVWTVAIGGSWALTIGILVWVLQ